MNTLAIEQSFPNENYSSKCIQIKMSILSCFDLPEYNSGIYISSKTDPFHILKFFKDEMIKGNTL